MDITPYPALLWRGFFVKMTQCIFDLFVRKYPVAFRQINLQTEHPMSGKFETRLADLGIELPNPSAPAANYVPFVQVGDLVYISGQISMDANGLVKGKLGDGYSIDDAYAAARLCGINLISQVRAACGGDLDRVVQVIKLNGFVNATQDFTDHPKVVNGASDLMVEVFGDQGRHARAAVGSSSLPLGVAVEVEGIFQIA